VWQEPRRSDGWQEIRREEFKVTGQEFRREESQ
jgi:hypothetical protein